MVASRRTKAPPSCRDFAVASHPSEQEFITSFLRPRVTSGDKSSCKFIHDADVYASHPADLTREHASALASNGEEAWYFFTEMRAKGGGRKARTVDTGEGCWHSEAGSKPVVDARGGHLGHRQSFSFVTKVDGRRVRSGWLMLELGLDDDGQDELTLCKVYFSPRAPKNKKPATTSTLSGRKRKATDSSDPDDASAPVRQRRCRRARMTSSKAAESSPSETEDDGETIGKPEGIHEEEPAAADGEADEAVDDEPVSFSSWLRNEGGTMEGFSWWIGNDDEETGKILEDISKEELERDDPATVVEFPPVPEIRLYDYDGDDLPVACSPVVREKDAAVCMWLTLDEMHEHPEARKILSPTRYLEEMRSPVEKNQ